MFQNVRVTFVRGKACSSRIALKQAKEMLTAKREQSLITREIFRVIKERSSLIEQRIIVLNERLHGAETALESPNVKHSILYVIPNNRNDFGCSEAVPETDQYGKKITFSSGSGNVQNS